VQFALDKEATPDNACSVGISHEKRSS